MSKLAKTFAKAFLLMQGFSFGLGICYGFELLELAQIMFHLALFSNLALTVFALLILVNAIEEVEV